MCVCSYIYYIYTYIAKPKLLCRYFKPDAVREADETPATICSGPLSKELVGTQGFLGPKRAIRIPKPLLRNWLAIIMRPGCSVFRLVGDAQGVLFSAPLRALCASGCCSS